MEWEYSRTWRMHWVLEENSCRRLYSIKDCAPYGQYHRREHGYDLLRFEKKIAHAKTVKELKEKAEAREKEA